MNEDEEESGVSSHGAPGTDPGPAGGPVSLQKDGGDAPSARPVPPGRYVPAGGPMPGRAAFQPGDPSTPGQPYPPFPHGMPGPVAPGPGAPPDPALEALVSGAAYAALGLLGAILGLLGSFSQGWTIGAVPIAAVALIVVNFAVAWLGGWAMGGRLGAVVPTLVWGTVAFGLSVRRTEGDLIVPGTVPGYVFIIGGLTAGVIAMSLVRSRRPPGEWLTGSTPFTRG